jgi:DNA invertase Pin-like site-specific DNA recombinase
MANVGYIRVSSADQNTARQLDGVQLDKTFIEKVSGATADREQLHAMFDYVREGDTVHVHEISRLARSLIDLNTLISDLNKKGVTVVFHQERMTFSPDREQEPLQQLMFNMLASFAQFERQIIKQRQAEGIAKAKERGEYMGRKKTIDDSAIIEAMSKDGASFRKVAKELSVSLSTVQRAMKKHSPAC